jgi:hypothetical protein
MSRYLVKGKSSALDRSSGVFLNSLADKLLSMSEKIDGKIKELETKQCAPLVQEPGFHLASVETPVMMIGIRYEYIEYIKRYGPPINGKFNQKIIDELRIELHIEPDF